MFQWDISVRDKDEAKYVLRQKQRGSYRLTFNKTVPLSVKVEEIIIMKPFTLLCINDIMLEKNKYQKQYSTY